MPMPLYAQRNDHVAIISGERLAAGFTAEQMTPTSSRRTSSGTPARRRGWPACCCSSLPAAPLRFSIFGSDRQQPAGATAHSSSASCHKRHFRSRRVIDATGRAISETRWNHIPPRRRGGSPACPAHMKRRADHLLKIAGMAKSEPIGVRGRRIRILRILSLKVLPPVARRCDRWLN